MVAGLGGSIIELSITFLFTACTSLKFIKIFTVFTGHINCVIVVIRRNSLECDDPSAFHTTTESRIFYFFFRSHSLPFVHFVIILIFVE